MPEHDRYPGYSNIRNGISSTQKGWGQGDATFQGVKKADIYFC